MRRKVGWLFFWLTMVFWLGNAGGCSTPWPNQNYRELHRPGGIDTSTVPVEPMGNEHLGVAYLAEEGEADPAAPADDAPPANDAPPADGDAAAPTPPQATPPATPAANPDATSTETEASLKGLSREHWPTVTITPDAGATSHYPTYFKDVDHFDDDNPAIDPAKPETAIQCPKREGWSRHNLYGIGCQPGKFLYDLVLAPYHMYKHAPWKQTTTP